MRLPTLLLAAAITTSPTLVLADPWNLTKAYSPSDLLNNFVYFTDKDPTNGLVTYQSKSGAQSLNLTSANDDTFILKVDDTEQRLDGRPSVRISSPDTFEDGVYIFNVSHVPTGCSTWPAFWTVTSDLAHWPIGGEIDVGEMANDQYPYDFVSAHTASNSCTIPAEVSTQTGVVASTNCSAYFPGNPGCRTALNGTSTPTWGPAYNTAGGGVWAMERSFGTGGNGVRVWYWPMGSAPSNVGTGSKSVDSSDWGTPSAHLPISSCHSSFGAHNIVIDITLAGDWAANTYAASGNCLATYGSVTNQVAYNGSSYADAYFAIHSVRVYGQGGGNANAAVSPQSMSSGSGSGSGAAGLIAAPHARLATGIAVLASVVLMAVATSTL